MGDMAAARCTACSIKVSGGPVSTSSSRSPPSDAFSPDVQRACSLICDSVAATTRRSSDTAGWLLPPPTPWHVFTKSSSPSAPALPCSASASASAGVTCRANPRVGCGTQNSSDWSGRDAGLREGLRAPGSPCRVPVLGWYSTRCSRVVNGSPVARKQRRIVRPSSWNVMASFSEGKEAFGAKYLSLSTSISGGLRLSLK
mmetsp:Transcript_17111/g.54960  ORF Transcript_17111/g.54960 Transcript_17111/m.54960 type:complete len:200 (+) Transcript_17111:270-869(+)